MTLFFSPPPPFIQLNFCIPSCRNNTQALYSLPLFLFFFLLLFQVYSNRGIVGVLWLLSSFSNNLIADLLSLLMSITHQWILPFIELHLVLLWNYAILQDTVLALFNPKHGILSHWGRWQRLHLLHASKGMYCLHWQDRLLGYWSLPCPFKSLDKVIRRTMSCTRAFWWV